MSDPHALTEFPEDQHDYETRQLIAQTVEQTLAKLREQERAQKLEDELANSESAFAEISDTLNSTRADVTELLRLFAGKQADRLNGVSVSAGENVTTINWYIDGEYGWVYAPVTCAALTKSMNKSIEQADKKRAEEPLVPLADELDDEIPF